MYIKIVHTVRFLRRINAASILFLRTFFVNFLDIFLSFFSQTRCCGSWIYRWNRFKTTGMYTVTILYLGDLTNFNMDAFAFYGNEDQYSNVQ
jgi:hypothetical protein